MKIDDQNLILSYKARTLGLDSVMLVVNKVHKPSHIYTGSEEVLYPSKCDVGTKHSTLTVS